MCKQWTQPQQNTEWRVFGCGGVGDVFLWLPQDNVHGPIPQSAHPGLHGTEHQQDRRFDHSYRPQGAVDQ